MVTSHPKQEVELENGILDEFVPVHGTREGEVSCVGSLPMREANGREPTQASILGTNEALDVSHKPVKGVATSALGENGGKTVRGHFEIDGLPEMAVRPVNVNFCWPHADGFAPESELVAFPECERDPAVECRFVERVVEPDDKGHALEAHGRAARRLLFVSGPSDSFGLVEHAVVDLVEIVDGVAVIQERGGAICDLAVLVEVVGAGSCLRGEAQ